MRAFRKTKDSSLASKDEGAKDKENTSDSRVIVRRSSCSRDSQLSPFILDGSEIILEEERSLRHFNGTFLNTPVSVRIARSRSSALRTLNYMVHIRHPNIEQLLGIVVDGGSTQNMLISTKAEGNSVADITSPTHISSITNWQRMLSIAKQASSALLYLHKTTGRAHPCLCSHSIMHDEHRWKTVVLITVRCPCCKTSPEETSRMGDVKILANILAKLVDSMTVNKAIFVAVPDGLISCLERFSSSAGGSANSMREFCLELSKYF